MREANHLRDLWEEDIFRIIIEYIHFNDIFGVIIIYYIYVHNQYLEMQF